MPINTLKIQEQQEKLLLKSVGLRYKSMIKKH